MTDLTYNRGAADRRVRRTRTSVRTTQGPTEQSRIANREVAQVVSSKKGSNLPAAFENFFGGLISASQTAAEAASIAVDYEIKRENETQKSMAAADALAGRESNKSLQNDADYVDTFDTVKGKRDGIGLADDYREAIAGLDVGADIDAFKAEFLAAQFGTGTDSDRYNEAVIATFEQQATAENTAFKQRRVAAVKQEVLNDHVSVAVAELNAGELDPSGLHELIETGVGLVGRDNRDAAMQAILAGVMNGADGPTAISTAISLLNAPGYEGTRSFAERFPEAAHVAEQALIRRQQGLDTSEAHHAYQSVGRVVNAAVQAGDLPGLLQATEYLEAVHNTHGANKLYATLQQQIDTAMIKLADDQLNVNEVHRLVGGGVPSNLDPNDLIDASDQYIKEVTGTAEFLSSGDDGDIALAALTAGAVGGVSKETKNYLEQSLSHPKMAEKVHLYLTQLEQVGRLKPADVLSEDSYLAWKAGRALVGLGKADGSELSLGEAIMEIREAKYDFTAEVNKIDYKGIMDADSAAEGKEKIVSKVLEGLGNALGQSEGDIRLGSLRTEILDTFAHAHVLFSNTVGGSVTDRVMEAVSGKFQDRIALAPGADDTYIAHKVQHVNPNMPRFGEEVANGKGGMENTIDTYREDIEALREKFLFLHDDTDEDSFSAVPYSPGQARGTNGYLVHTDGFPVTFQAGATYTLGNDRGDRTDILFSTADEILKTLPKGFGLSKVKDAGEDVYHLTYTPRFKDTRTLEELGTAWTAPHLRRQIRRGRNR